MGIANAGKKKIGLFSAFAQIVSGAWEGRSIASGLAALSQTKKIERAIRTGSVLDGQIYGEPLRESFNAAAARVEAAVASSAPGFRVEGVSVWGQSRAAHGGGLRVIDFHVGFFGRDGEGRARLFSSRERVPNGVGTLNEAEEAFAQWMIDEKITIVRAGEHWAWKTTKKSDGAAFFVLHPEKAVEGREFLQAQIRLGWRSSAQIESRQAELGQAKARALSQKAQAASQADPSPIETRLRELLPESVLDRALEIEAAQAEAGQLRQAAELRPEREKSSPRAKSASGQARRI